MRSSISIGSVIATLAASALAGAMARRQVSTDVVTVTLTAGATLTTYTQAPDPTRSLAEVYRTCKKDAVYLGLFSNSYIEYDASTACLSLLGSSTATTCIDYNTDREYAIRPSSAADTDRHRTVYATTTYTATVTSTTTVPKSTVTSTDTVKAFAAIEPNKIATSSAESQDVKLNRRLATSTPVFDPIASIASACACNTKLSAITQKAVCVSTLTIARDEILYTTTTVYTTTTAGVTTTDVTQTVTTSLSAVSSLSVSSSTWLVTSSPVPDSESGSKEWSDWKGWVTTPSVSTSSSSKSKLTSSKTSSTSSSTVSPSGCPSINGTTFSSNSKDCTYYQRICGRTYADSDFMKTEYYFSTPEQCTAVCDGARAANRAYCIGIVWNTTTGATANCRLLTSVKNPLDDPASIALLLMSDKNCGTTTMSSTFRTTSGVSTTSSPSQRTYMNTTKPYDPSTCTTTPLSNTSYSRTTESRVVTISSDNFTTTVTGTVTSTSATYPISSTTTITTSTWYNTTTSTTSSPSMTPTATSCPDTSAKTVTAYKTETATVTSTWTSTMTAPCKDPHGSPHKPMKSCPPQKEPAQTVYITTTSNRTVYVTDISSFTATTTATATATITTASDVTTTTTATSTVTVTKTVDPWKGAKGADGKDGKGKKDEKDGKDGKGEGEGKGQDYEDKDGKDGKDGKDNSSDNDWKA